MSGRARKFWGEQGGFLSLVKAGDGEVLEADFQGALSVLVQTDVSHFGFSLTPWKPA